MPPLLVLRVQAVEGRREPLLARGVRQQVARELLGRETVEGFVAVERPDHPVAPGPHRAWAIHLVAVRVGVAREIEPVGRHPLAVARRGEQAVHHFFKRLARRVLLEGVQLRHRRRQAREVKRHAP